MVGKWTHRLCSYFAVLWTGLTLKKVAEYIQDMPVYNIVNGGQVWVEIMDYPFVVIDQTMFRQIIWTS